MKRIRYFVVIFFISVVQSLFAQDTTLPLSLHKAREMAIANSLEIFSKETDVRIAEDHVALEKIKRYPTVSGDLNLQRNSIIPVTPVPAKAFDPAAPVDEIRPLQFATKWSGNTGLNASYDLFNPNLKSESQSLTLKKIEQQGELLAYQWDRERFRNYPTLTLGGYYGTSYFGNNFDIFKDRNFHGTNILKSTFTSVIDFEHRLIEKHGVTYFFTGKYVSIISGD